jgi:hypothetical protein
MNIDSKFFYFNINIVFYYCLHDRLTYIRAIISLHTIVWLDTSQFIYDYYIIIFCQNNITPRNFIKVQNDFVYKFFTM